MMRAGRDYITKGRAKPQKQIVRSKRPASSEKKRVTSSPNKNKPTLKLR